MSDMLTAREAAERLKLSTRKVYQLAAAGEIASHRFGAAVRFDPADLDEYKSRCRSPATTRAAGSSNLTASLPGSESALTAYFRKAGRVPRRTPTTAAKQAASTTLHLVQTSPSR